MYLVRSHRASQRSRCLVRCGSTGSVNRWDRDHLEERITFQFSAGEESGYGGEDQSGCGWERVEDF